MFYYIFAIVGMESFQDLVKYSGYDEDSELYCGNEKLQDSDFWRDHYCNNNFNDIIHAFIVLFELTVVNQWHDILLYKLIDWSHNITMVLCCILCSDVL